MARRPRCRSNQIWSGPNPDPWFEKPCKFMGLSLFSSSVAIENMWFNGWFIFNTARLFLLTSKWDKLLLAVVLSDQQIKYFLYLKPHEPPNHFVICFVMYIHLHEEWKRRCQNTCKAGAATGGFWLGEKSMFYAFPSQKLEDNFGPAPTISHNQKLCTQGVYFLRVDKLDLDHMKKTSTRDSNIQISSSA